MVGQGGRPDHALLLWLFSVVALLGARLDRQARIKISVSAWYQKQRPTFADTLAAVRREIWSEQGFVVPGRQPIPQNYRQPSAKASPMPSATPPEWQTSS